MLFVQKICGLLIQNFLKKIFAYEKKRTNFQKRKKDIGCNGLGDTAQLLTFLAENVDFFSK